MVQGRFPCPAVMPGCLCTPQRQLSGLIVTLEFPFCNHGYQINISNGNHDFRSYKIISSNLYIACHWFYLNSAFDIHDFNLAVNLWKITRNLRFFCSYSDSSHYSLYSSASIGCSRMIGLQSLHARLMAWASATVVIAFASSMTTLEYLMPSLDDACFSENFVITS